MTPLEIAVALAASELTKGETPQTKFVPFVERLGVKLTRPQRVLCLVAFDGAQPRDMGGDDRAIARKIFGDVEEVSEQARSVLVAVCGARGGKSYILGGLRLLHLAATVSLRSLAPGEHAAGLIVAPDMRLARQTLRYVLGAVATGKTGLAVESENADGCVLRRSDGKVVRIECLPATRGGSALRARSLVGAILDECAFFRDASYKVNDEELYNAVAPRVLPGGGLVIASTPWAEMGLLYTEFKRNWSNPQTALAAHAPTLLLRDDEHTRTFVAREQARDPENARREFGAGFMVSSAVVFFDHGAIDAAIDPTRPLELPPLLKGSAGAGGDFGFRRNSSALAIVENHTELLHLALLREMRPEKQALKPSLVVKDFATDIKRYGCDGIVADGHYKESVREHLETEDLAFIDAPEGMTGKLEVYTVARGILHEGRLRVPKHDKLRQQLRDVQKRPTSGGGLTIIQPEDAAGAHGDLVSALVNAIWKANRLKPEVDPDIGTEDWFKRQARARMSEEEQREVDQWDAKQRRNRTTSQLLNL